MRTMYDSTSPWDVPRDAQLIAGYVDGRYRWPQEWWDLFPHSVHVRISAIGEEVAPVGDVEKGCIWPVGNAVPWVRRARAAGYDPTIYVNHDNDWGPCRAAFHAAGEPEPHWWVARYDGVAIIPNGAIGKQYAHPADPPGSRPSGPWEVDKHYDVSVVADYWPGIDTGDDMEPWQLVKAIEDTKYDTDNDGTPDRSLVNIGIQTMWDGWEALTLLRDLKTQIAGLTERVERLETSGVPVTVDYDTLAARVNDVADARRRDGDTGTGPET
jgi:hypothetical protein